MEKIVGVINRGEMETKIVEILECPQFGYRFDAMGKESLPLAVDLAILQSRKGSSEIDKLISRVR